MSDLVAALREAVAGESPRRVAELLDGVPERERPALRVVLKVDREGLGRPAWAVAAAGLEGGAAAVARRLRTAQMPGGWQPVEGSPSSASWWAPGWNLLARVLLRRQVDWLPDLVTRLATVESRERYDSRHVLTERLRQGLGLRRPTGAGYLRWVVERHLLEPWQHDELSITERLRREPDPTALVAAVLAVPEIGVELQIARTAPTEAWWSPGWREALLELVADGTLHRAPLLDALAAALALGGSARHQNSLAYLLAALEPTPQETTVRLRELCTLLPEAAGTVAEVVLKLVRAAVGAGAVSPAEAVEVTVEALRRREKGVVRAHVRWLAGLPTQDPALRDVVLLALSDAFGHEHHDLAQLAWTSVDRLQSGASETVRAELLARALNLPRDVQVEAVRVLGGTPDARVLDVLASDALASDALASDVPAAAAPITPPVAPHPPRVQDLLELVAAISEHTQRGRPSEAERVLDGLARFGAHHLEALAAALAPTAESFALWWERDAHFAPYPFLADATRRPGSPRWRGEKPGRPGPLPSAGPGILALRAQEVVERVRAGIAAPLLAFPDTALGHIDPERVLEDLGRSVAAGLAPGPLDLEQTWLRYPRDIVDEEHLARLRALATPAADQLAQRLEQWLSPGGIPEAVVQPVSVPLQARRYGYEDTSEYPHWPLVTLKGPVGATPLVERGFDGATLPERVVRERWSGGLAALTTSSTLPSHREVSAAELLVPLVDLEHKQGAATVTTLALLPELGGPTGRATHLALAYGLLSNDERARLGGVDAVHGFAVRGGLDATMAGAALGKVLTLEEAKLVRLTRSLTPLAHDDRAGVRKFTARYLLAALAPVLPLRRSGLADLLALAADAAHGTGPHPPVDGLAELAASGGRSRNVTEARRVLTQLA